MKGWTMREILFRAKRIDNGEWVEGFYSQLPKPSLGATIITNGDLCAEDVSDYIIVNESKQHSNFSNAYPIEVVECEYYEIDSETLCQYTGLKDKNGNRIWEGDILKGFTYPFLCDGEFNYYAIVEWSEEYKYFFLYTIKNPKSTVRGISEGNSELFEDFNSDDWEVIGNNFDDENLLED